PVNPAPLVAPRIRLTASPSHVRAGRRTQLTFHASITAGSRVHLLPGANIRVAGRRARTDARGRARVTVPPLAAGRARATATLIGLKVGSVDVRVQR
ncbi:MAG: hypothetical protein QOF57_106, partial [Frankiaceae bacterium]|nr:hypothetical protein [Frankiaceae bacterium]